MKTSPSTTSAERSRKWWVVLAVLLSLSAITYLREPRGSVSARELTGETMGTTYRVVLGPSGANVSLDDVQRAVDSALVAVNAVMSTYIPESELSRLNARAGSGAVGLSSSLADVLREAMAVFAQSNGHFDVTVGPLVDAWGFGAPRRDSTPPTDSALTALRDMVGSDKLEMRGDTLVRHRAGMQIDLSAIAKGHGVDVVSTLLVARGLGDHLVEIGGELRARGVNVRGERFRVGIEEPDPDRVRVRLAVLLQDRALATSGNYRNYYEVDGVRYVHTLDPRSGRPVQHTLLAVSVLHESCVTADAWATALLAAGPEQAWALAEANGLDVLLLVDGGGGQVTERATPGFAAIVQRIPRQGD